MTESDDTATVLVVDDERDLADMYVEWLEADFDVEVAYGGEEAIESLSEDVDVVLLDRLMPGVSGDEVLAEIESRGYDPWVAMITAVEPDFDIVAMGFDDYLVKPVFADDVRATVEQLLSRASYDERLQRYFALVSKRAALEEYRSVDELESNEEYVELTEEIDSLRAELDEMMEEFVDSEFEAMFHALDRTPQREG
jgi:DNA-binding response OmpR family regulator